MTVRKQRRLRASIGVPFFLKLLPGRGYVALESGQVERQFQERREGEQVSAEVRGRLFGEADTCRAVAAFLQGSAQLALAGEVGLAAQGQNRASWSGLEEELQSRRCPGGMAVLPDGALAL